MKSETKFKIVVIALTIYVFVLMAFIIHLLGSIRDYHYAQVLLEVVPPFALTAAP